MQDIIYLLPGYLCLYGGTTTSEQKVCCGETKFKFQKWVSSHFRSVELNLRQLNHILLLYPVNNTKL